MERKLLYEIGNLYKGYPWAVEAVKEFDSVEIHGPFSCESQADWYAHGLIGEVGDTEAYKSWQGYRSIKVIRLETPQAGRLIEWVRDGDDSGHYEYGKAALT